MAILNSTERFSSRVANYVRCRPGYPPEMLEVLKDECGLTPGTVVADVGSGTGFLAKLFLANGNQVYGVEPNREMRMAGEDFLRGFPNFMSVIGTAEATTLPDGSVDFVTAGQAAHWFDATKARREFLRILRPGGWLILAWNDRSTEATPLLMEYERLLQAYCPEYAEVQRQGVTGVSDVEPFFAPARARVKSFSCRQVFEYDGLEGRLLSSSYAPLEGHPNYRPMLNELREIFERQQVNGQVSLDYETKMYYGRIA
jgi:SAM-dependent methyltransferase